MSAIYEAEFAWACAWTNGNPRPFIMVGTVAETRKAAIEKFVARWAVNRTEPVMASWRRAYREGARCLRVKVSPSGDRP